MAVEHEMCKILALHFSPALRRPFIYRSMTNMGGAVVYTIRTLFFNLSVVVTKREVRNIIRSTRARIGIA